MKFATLLTRLMLIHTQKEFCWTFHQDYMLHKNLFYQQSKLEKRSLVLLWKKHYQQKGKQVSRLLLQDPAWIHSLMRRRKTPVIIQGKASGMTISSELVFWRFLTLSKTREEVSIKSEPTQPVTSVLTSLFHKDGSMRKITKAELLHKLEENGPGVKLLPTHVGTAAIYIRDAMAILQMMRGDIRPHFSN